MAINMKRMIHRKYQIRINNFQKIMKSYEMDYTII